MKFNWYDVIPGVGPLDLAKQYFYDDPAAEIKGAYDKALGQTQENAQKLQDFYMGREENAENYYKPLQKMFGQAYGQSGIAAPQVPGPLSMAYGGGR